MPTRALHTEIEIVAPPQRVWEVLTDLPAWPEWNPALAGLELRGPLREETRGMLSLRIPGPVDPPPIPVRLVSVRPPHELAWVGGTPGLMVGRHGFELRPSPHGTRVIHTETFRGLLAPVVITLLRPRLMKAYRALNRALRDRCERA